jgi:hypothetical protein
LANIVYQKIQKDLIFKEYSLRKLIENHRSFITQDLPLGLVILDLKMTSIIYSNEIFRAMFSDQHPLVSILENFKTASGSLENQTLLNKIKDQNYDSFHTFLEP